MDSVELYNKKIAESRKTIIDQTKIINDATANIEEIKKSINDATVKLNEAKLVIEKHNKEELDIKNSKLIEINRKIEMANSMLTKEYAIDYITKHQGFIDDRALYCLRYKKTEGDRAGNSLPYSTKTTKDEFFKYLRGYETSFLKHMNTKGKQTMWNCEFFYSSDNNYDPTFSFDFKIELEDILQ